MTLRHLAVVAILTMTAGCASKDGPGAMSLTTDSKKNGATVGGQTTSRKKAGNECSQLRGQMQVAILRIKHRDNADDGSALARGLQGAVVSLFGGTGHGRDPKALAKTDYDKLVANNQRLKDMKCKTYNLQKELAPPPKN